MRQFSHQFCWKKTSYGSLTRNNFGSAKDEMKSLTPYHGSHAILVPFLHTVFIGNRKAFPWQFWRSAEPTKWKVNFRVKMNRVKGFWWLLLLIHYMNLRMIIMFIDRVRQGCFPLSYLESDCTWRQYQWRCGLYRFWDPILQFFLIWWNITHYLSFFWKVATKKQPHPLSVTFCTITGWPVVF